MIKCNVQGLRALDLAPFPGERTRGISAFVRLKDEAEWCVPALESIAGWCDEIVIALQGEQSDGTDNLVNVWAAEKPHCVVVRYPFDSVPNGPSHGNDVVPGSVYERAYFYNWVLSFTTYSHALKWDGDMVAHDFAGPMLRHLAERYDVVRFGGVDIVGDMQVGERVRCATEPRLFRVTGSTFYVSGEMCEVFSLGSSPAGYVVDEPLFLHFKWAKSFASATKAWPENWSTTEHFRRIVERAAPVRAYDGPIPTVLRQ